MAGLTIGGPDDHLGMPDLALTVNLPSLTARDRTQLVFENITLRHQLAVYRRSVHLSISRTLHTLSRSPSR